MENLFVSVVVPIYNGERFIDRCVLSIINQSYKHLDIILVNDGSTDDSGKLCDKYANLDSRIRVIHKPNGGLVSSRKAGLGIAIGSYVLYVDGDDWIEDNLVEDYMHQVYKFNADIVIASHIVNLEGNTKVLKNTIPAGVYDKNTLRSKVYPHMMYTGKFSQFGIFSYSWGKLYKKSLLLPNQGSVSENITMGEDALCLYPTLLDASIVVILDQPYYHYRQRADSLIKTLRTVDISKMMIVYENLKKAFQNKKVIDIMQPQLQQYLLSLLTINTEGPTLCGEFDIYPFLKLNSTKNIAICGGGTFGQHLYKKIDKDGVHNIVAWVDDRWQYYSRLGLPITSVQALNSIDYDYILVAFIDEDNSDQAVAELVKRGVSGNRIVQITHYDTKNIHKHLLKYKINL